MRTFHVGTFCRILPAEINRQTVMETVEITLVVNAETPPSHLVIGNLLKMIAPNVEPILSEINEIPHVPYLNER